MNQWKRTLYSIGLLLAAVMLDGQLSLHLANVLSTRIGQIIPHLTILVLVILTGHLQRKPMYFLAGIFGYMMDTYYVGFIGIYMVGFFVTVYLVEYLKDYFSVNIFYYVLMGIFGMIIVEVFAFSIYSMLNVVHWSLWKFVKERLLVTVIVNSLLMFGLAPLLNQLLIRVHDQ